MAHPLANGMSGSPEKQDSQDVLSAWAKKYRGATVADLDLPPALSTSPTTSVADALLSASSHDYSHLTVVSESNRSLLGYLPISRLQHLLNNKQLLPSDPVAKAMVRFKRDRGRKYQVITMETELWELEGFFESVGQLSTGSKQDFAVVTDGGRKFVLGVVTRSDLEEFVRRRPS